MMQKRLLFAVPLASLMIGGSASMANADDVWDSVAECESGGNWSTNTGNGFQGGLQFTPSTWEAYGGSGSAANASKSEQIRVAQNVLEGQGPGAWPTCGQKAGLTQGNGGSSNNEPSPEPTAEPTQEAEPTPEPTQEAPAPEPTPTEEPQNDESNEVAPEEAPEPTEAPSPEPTNEVAPEPEAPESTSVDEAPENAPAPQAPSNVAGNTYVVKSGDTLGKIADAQNVNGGWEAIYELNSDSMSSPHVLNIGQELTLPQ